MLHLRVVNVEQIGVNLLELIIESLIIAMSTVS